MYGVPSKQLKDFKPTSDIWADTYPTGEDRGAAAALDQLKGAVQRLSGVMAGMSDDSLSRGTKATEGQSGDPYGRLKSLKGLHDDGVLTDKEFAAKKAELLEEL